VDSRARYRTLFYQSEDRDPSSRAIGKGTEKKNSLLSINVRSTLCIATLDIQFFLSFVETFI
jgi:hypothetical protein